MSRRRTGTRPMAAVGITLGILALSPNLLRAAVVVTDAAAFAIAIDANDAVSVDCSGGFVRVFDDGAPTTYTTACAAVTTLAVTATGAFDNTIDLSGVTAAAFTTMAAAPLPVSIVSGAGVDTLTGSPLNDSITGGPGSETQLGGAGTDTFIWNPGDGSDTLVGGTGTDTMLFNGSAGNEVFATNAQGAGFRFTRDLGNIVMNATEVEAITLNALGGDDNVATVPLAGTSQNLVGGTQTTADVLTIDAQGGCVVPSGPGTVTIAGAQPITFSEFEQVNFTNQCVVAEVPTLGPVALAALAAFLALAAILLMRSQSSG